MKLSFADTGLTAIDSLKGVDAFCLFVSEDERPLRGAAGFIDWRLCGGLSRILKEGRFVGALGDALLFPAAGRLPGERVFCFGAGKRSDLARGGFATIVRKACEAMTLAGSQAFAADLPQVHGLDEAERARVFVAEGLTRFKGERVILLGEGKALAKAFAHAGDQMKALEIDKEPLGSIAIVSAPPRTSSHPAKAAHAR